MQKLIYRFRQSIVGKFIGYFFVLIAGYHIIVTILGYGILGGNSQTIISIVRDLIWILFILLVSILYITNMGEYIKKRGKARIWFVILVIFSVGISFLAGSSVGDILIGVKYGFYYLFIFLTASFVGFVGLKTINKSQLQRMQYFLMGILVFGFVWQIMKMIRPELFMNIGYGKFDDFYFGAKPPLYYLTGFEGTSRWQGIFAGPNNYAYFLIAFLPVILLRWNTRWEKLKNIVRNPVGNLNLLLVGLWLVAIALTLSRSAIVGVVFIFALLAKNRIKQHKKASLIILGVLIIGFVGLSILKYESTLGHLHAKLAYIGEIIDNPLGHGLGISGPAIHHNGTMLPENYFMQIMLDIGTVGFLIWIVVIFQILLIFKNIRSYFGKNNTRAIHTNEQVIFLLWSRLYIGWTALLIIGLFLHVFEDSMVNYLFFVSFGLLSGYLSKIYDKSDIRLKDLFVK